MKIIKQYFLNMHLRKKITYLVLTATFLILLFCQSLLYTLASDTINAQARTAAKATLTQANNYVNNTVRGIAERLYYVRMDANFEDTLTRFLLDEISPITQAKATSRLAGALSMHKMLEPMIDSIYLYTPKGTFTDMSTLTDSNFHFTDTALYQDAQKSPKVINWGKAQTDEIFITKRTVIPVTYRFEVSGIGGQCYLLANIRQSAFTNFIRQLFPSDSAQMMLVDAYGNAITSAPQPIFETLLQDADLRNSILNHEELMQNFKTGGDDYLLACTEVPSTAWHIVYLQSKSAVNQELSRLRRIYSAVSIFAALVLFVCVTKIARSVTLPLQQLSDTMGNVGIAHYEIEFSYTGGGEIRELADSFNSMVRHTQKLLAEQSIYIAQLQTEKENVRVEQQLKRRAELKALQAQINPHFLYNTLDSIRWKADELGADEISRMTTALATLFRIGLSRGREIITVQDELKHVKSYLEIQKLRYGDKLDFTVSADETLFTCYTIKLVLQPLVENAIYHGIKEKEGNGKIELTIKRVQNTLCCTVSDDGIGIEPEKLVRLQTDLTRVISVSGEGYGIFNVNERIHLYFGSGYGLSINSQYGVGTKVTLSMPIVEEKELEKYVPYPDSGR